MLDSSFFSPYARFCYLKTDPEQADLSHVNDLLPLERVLVNHAVRKRQSEFADARWCAHQALAHFGVPLNVPILRGDRGMPLWPAGYTGSLSHTEGLRVAIVAPTTQIRSVGIDIEVDGALPEGIVGQVARPGELHQLHRLHERGVRHPERVLFCAKEATYKAWFPLTHRWLGFDQAEIDVRSDGTFLSYLLVRPTPVPLIHGKWAISEGYVIAYTEVCPQQLLGA